jgi:hypothetical protein
VTIDYFLASEVEKMCVNRVNSSSFLASVANEIKKREHHFVGVVKTAHKNFPKVFLEQTMSDWPGGTYLVMKSKFG